WLGNRPGGKNDLEACAALARPGNPTGPVLAKIRPRGAAGFGFYPLQCGRIHRNILAVQTVLPLADPSPHRVRCLLGTDPHYRVDLQPHFAAADRARTVCRTLTDLAWPEGAECLHLLGCRFVLSERPGHQCHCSTGRAGHRRAGDWPRSAEDV